jgi:hypothetical membrane protein
MADKLLRAAGWCGVASPMVSSTLIFVSIAMSPWFSWQNNGLSALGVSGTPNFFNAGIIGGGSLYLVFTLGFARWQPARSRLETVARAALIGGAIGLILVGIFNDDSGRIHDVVAATYYVATPVAYLLSGGDWLRRGERVPGILTIAAGLAALLAIAVVPHRQRAVPEILAATIIGSWTFAMSVKMLVESGGQPARE